MCLWLLVHTPQIFQVFHMIKHGRHFDVGVRIKHPGFFHVPTIPKLFLQEPFVNIDLHTK